MADKKRLQELVDEYNRRGALDQMPAELKQAVEVFGLSTEDPNIRSMSRRARRDMEAGKRYEVTPQNEEEQRVVDSANAGDVNIYRLPDMDSDDPHAGDIYSENGVFPTNLSRYFRTKDSLDEVMPDLGIEDTIGYGGPEMLARASEAAMSMGSGLASLIDSAGMQLPSSLVGRAVGVFDEELGQDISDKSKDYAQAAWMRHQAMPALQTGAVLAGGAVPFTQAPRIASRISPIFNSMWGQRLASGLGGYTGLQAAAYGGGDFDPVFAEEINTADPGHLTSLMGMEPVDTGIEMQYAAPLLGALAPSVSNAVRSLSPSGRQAVANERALNWLANRVDPDEVENLQGAERAADLDPRGAAVAVRFGSGVEGSGGNRFGEFLDQRKEDRARRMTNAMSEVMGEDANTHLLGRNQTMRPGNTEAADFEPDFDPFDYDRAPDQVVRYQDEVLAAPVVARDRGYAHGGWLPDEELDLSDPNRATTHRAAEHLSHMADQFGLNTKLARRDAANRTEYAADGREAIPRPYDLNGRTVDPIDHLSRERVDNMLVERGVARSHIEPNADDDAWLAAERARRAALPDNEREGIGRLPSRSLVARRRTLRELRDREVVSQGYDEANAANTTQNPRFLQEIKRQAQAGRQSAAGGTNPDGFLVSDYDDIIGLSKDLLYRVRAQGPQGPMTGQRGYLVGDTYFAHFRRAVSTDDSGKVKGAFSDGEGAFRSGTRTEDVIRQTRELRDAVTRQSRDTRFSTQRNGELPSTRENVTLAAREALHAYRLGALRGYMRELQSPTMLDARTHNQFNADVVTKLNAIFDNPQQAQRYLEILASERRMKATENRARHGSQTATNEADDLLFGQQNGDIASAVAEAASGNIGSATWNLAKRFLTNRYYRYGVGMTRQTADAVAEHMMREDVRALAAELRAARRGNRPPQMSRLPVGTQANLMAAADAVDEAAGATTGRAAGQAAGDATDAAAGAERAADDNAVRFSDPGDDEISRRDDMMRRYFGPERLNEDGQPLIPDAYTENGRTVDPIDQMTINEITAALEDRGFVRSEFGDADNMRSMLRQVRMDEAFMAERDARARSRFSDPGGDEVARRAAEFDTGLEVDDGTNPPSMTGTVGGGLRVEIEAGGYAFPGEVIEDLGGGGKRIRLDSGEVVTAPDDIIKPGAPRVNDPIDVPDTDVPAAPRRIDPDEPIEMPDRSGKPKGLTPEQRGILGEYGVHPQDIDEARAARDPEYLMDRARAVMDRDQQARTRYGGDRAQSERQEGPAFGPGQLRDDLRRDHYSSSVNLPRPERMGDGRFRSRRNFVRPSEAEAMMHELESDTRMARDNARETQHSRDIAQRQASEMERQRDAVRDNARERRAENRDLRRSLDTAERSNDELQAKLDETNSRLDRLTENLSARISRDRKMTGDEVNRSVDELDEAVTNIGQQTVDLNNEIWSQVKVAQDVIGGFGARGAEASARLDEAVTAIRSGNDPIAALQRLDDELNAMSEHNIKVDDPQTIAQVMDIETPPQVTRRAVMPSHRIKARKASNAVADIARAYKDLSDLRARATEIRNQASRAARRNPGLKPVRDVLNARMRAIDSIGKRDPSAADAGFGSRDRPGVTQSEAEQAVRRVLPNSQVTVKVVDDVVGAVQDAFPNAEINGRKVAAMMDNGGEVTIFLDRILSRPGDAVEEAVHVALRVGAVDAKTKRALYAAGTRWRKSVIDKTGRDPLEDVATPRKPKGRTRDQIRDARREFSEELEEETIARFLASGEAPKAPQYRKVVTDTRSRLRRMVDRIRSVFSKSYREKMKAEEGRRRGLADQRRRNTEVYGELEGMRTGSLDAATDNAIQRRRRRIIASRRRDGLRELNRSARQ